MKGLILSGGKGTRLRPITHTNSKQLVPVANKPILFYCIESIRDAGIDDIGIIVGDTKQEIMSAVGDGSNFGVKISYIEQEAPLGIAHAVLISRDFIKDEPFIVYLGDNLLIEGIRPFVRRFENRKPHAQILLVKVPNPSQFGVAELDGDRIKSLEEKPKNPKSNLALVGVYLFDSTIFDAASKIKPSWRNELEITEAIQYLIDHNHTVEAQIISGWWKDTGRIEDLLEANRVVLSSFSLDIRGKIDENSRIEGDVVLEAGSEIVNSVIRGPAIIGERTKIINSFIGPFTSIYYDVLIRNSEIEHSIILENSIVDGIGSRIEDSLIGQNVRVEKSNKLPKAYRFMLGDSSKVEIL
jgi:glucose-1-phosphate thymidylyltransferase